MHSPPFLAGITRDLVLVRKAGPQLVEHWDQPPQLDHKQSVGKIETLMDGTAVTRGPGGLVGWTVVDVSESNPLPPPLGIQVFPSLSNCSAGGHVHT